MLSHLLRNRVAQRVASTSTSTARGRLLLVVASSSSAAPTALLRPTMLLRNSATAAAGTEIAEAEFKNDGDDDFHAGDDLSTDVEQPQQAFDITEATMQEIHDLAVAMLHHKNLSRKYNHDLAHAIVEHTYRHIRDWERGDTLFQEWMDKLEKILTPEMMATIMKSAGHQGAFPVNPTNSSPNLDKEVDTASPDSHRGFRAHPLAEQGVIDGPRRPLNKRLPSSVATRWRRHTQSGFAKTFMHTPYQVQMLRPDASPELMAMTRRERDARTVVCLAELTKEPHPKGSPRGRTQPVQVRKRLIHVVSNAMGYDKEHE